MARVSRLRASIAIVLACSGCVSARLVELKHLDVPPAAPPAGASWREDLGALFDQYERAPVLAPEDTRLEPLYGGLTTLAYFGADPAPRVADQRVPVGARVRGRSLVDACAARPDPEAAATALETTGVPHFAPVWIPLAAHGGAAPAGATCDTHGAPVGASRHDVFCAYGRLALQPEAGRTLVVVVHGLFDSGAQAYLQRMAAELVRLGHSVLVPDLRDHGNTLRAAPEIATTLGTVEGRDVLAMVQAARMACGARIGRAGVAGVSGGGLAAIRAFAEDRERSLEAGAIALSPLLDVPATVANLGETGACPLARSIELTWVETALITGASGATFFGGAAIDRALAGEPLDRHTAIATGIGAAVGLLGGVVADAWLDGGSEPCLAEHAIALMIEDALHVRWRALQAPGLGATMSASGRRAAPDSITIDTYLRERVQFSAARLGVELATIDPGRLTHDLTTAPGSNARLLVIGGSDDPVTRSAAFRAFSEGVRRLPRVYAREVRHGGHGAMWIVQPAITHRIFARFFQ